MRVLFPTTNRVHMARQKKLIEKLDEIGVDVVIKEYTPDESMLMDEKAMGVMLYFSTIINKGDFDAVIIRGDRFEMLPVAMLSAYNNIPIIHIEGGDISGAIDNKIRNAITALADLHFPTNYQSKGRLLEMGLGQGAIFDFGSLDVELAMESGIAPLEDFVLMCHHPMEGENPEHILSAIKKELDCKVIIIKSNSDNGKSFGDVEVPPDEYLKLLKSAKMLIGNSSSFIKEASISGKPVILVGDRQRGRLLPENVVTCRCNPNSISSSIKAQMSKEYQPSNIYYKKDTAENIANTIKEYIYERQKTAFGNRDGGDR